MGLGAQRSFSLSALLVGLSFTVLDLLFIVFLNDWGDREVDAIKRRMFPTQCSKKTIPDGILPARALLAAGIAAGTFASAVAFGAELWLARPFFFEIGLFALSIFVAYTLPPLALNYRGGGELLEMIGVGIVLPWLHAYLQGGAAFVPGLWLLVGFACLSLASAIASGLSDERSDRIGKKRTFVTLFGNTLARRTIEVLTFGGAGAWIATGALGLLPIWLTAAPAAVTIGYGVRMLARSREAGTDAFAAQKRYKALLHHAIWRGALVAAMLLGWWHLFG
jgi:1,4-dihydroxy-2-naphthoate octaprenyltransferase/chlorophyll synthase